MHPGDSLTGGQRLVYVIVLGLLTALGPFTIDLYLPAFPQVQDDLGVSESAVQLTLGATMVGFALGQLIVGPWSDKVGRRLPLLLTSVLHVLASVGVMLSSNIEMLTVFRVLQGMGAAAGSVVAMAMVRDLFGGRPLVRMLSRLALINGLAPILAPVIGSQLLQITNWQGIFVFLGLYGVVVVLAVAFFIRETLPPERRQGVAGQNSTVLQRYRNVFRDRVYVGTLFVGAFVFSGLFGYLQASPFLFQNHFGFDEQQFGLLFAINSIGVMIGVQASSRLTKYVGPQWILAASTSALIISAALIAVGDMMDWGFWGVAIPLWCFIAACGFSFPCIQVLALVNHGHQAGTAASMLGASNFGVAGLISPLVGMLTATFVDFPAMPMAVVMLASATIAALSLWLIVRPASVPALTD